MISPEEFQKKHFPSGDVQKTSDTVHILVYPKQIAGFAIKFCRDYRVISFSIFHETIREHFKCYKIKNTQNKLRLKFTEDEKLEFLMLWFS